MDRKQCDKIDCHCEEHESATWQSKKSKLSLPSRQKVAFTLAEVLITLSILGIVAVITIPNMINKISDRTQINGLKIAYSTIDNALQQMYAIEGLPSTWTDWTNDTTQNSNLFASKLSKYLAVQKYCGSDSGCMPNWRDTDYYGSTKVATYRTLTGDKNTSSSWTEFNTHGKMLLKNGMMIATFMRGGDIKSVMKDKTAKPAFWSFYLRVDTNGRKGPNRYGYDVFFLWLNDWGLIPSGGSADKTYCTIGPSMAASAYNRGISCSYWVIKHNNMDYKYRDISNEW